MKTEIIIKECAKDLAQSTDYDQSEFINRFALELIVCCKDKDLTGLQPCNIAGKLDKSGVLLVKSLYEFIKLREEAQ